jgi:hypothetical protein
LLQAIGKKDFSGDFSPGSICQICPARGANCLSTPGRDIVRQRAISSYATIRFASAGMAGKQ